MTSKPDIHTKLHPGNLSPPVRQPLMPVTQRPQAVMCRGLGSNLWDEDGKQYLDFLQGWAVNALGHNAPEVVEAVSRQARLLITPSPALHNRPQLELADNLTTHTGLAAVHFSNSGAEANETAIKLARKWGRLHRNGAYRILTTEGAFHGRTLATMAASGKPGWPMLFPPYPDGFARLPFGDIEATRGAIDKNTVAIMVEPIQGEAGVVVPPPEYLTALRQLADAHDLLLIFDEIQTGVGRTGRFLSCHWDGVQPDILTLGKGLGGGLPLSATLANDRANCFQAGDQGGTFNGNPLTTAVGQAVVATVSAPAFLQTVRERGETFGTMLQDLTALPDVDHTRGRGLLHALVLNRPIAADIASIAMEQGLLINAARENVLRFMPSLRVTEAELGECVAILRACFHA